MVPFETAKLDRLMEEAGIALLLASTRHNIRYLTGGYAFHQHEHATRLAQTQYLPLLGYPSTRLQDTFYVGRPDEQGQMNVHGLWPATRLFAPSGTVTAADTAAGMTEKLGLAEAVIGLELPFLPADAFAALQRALPRARFVDATPTLDRLRAIKTPTELALLRTVYDRTAEATRATFAAGRPGITTRAIEARLRQEMALRGLTFLWGFTCAGPGTLRAPSSAPWERGRILHIDAGGEERDYLADLCRMGSLGEPSALARELHAACLEVQDRVRGMVRAGVPCRELLREGERICREQRVAAQGSFVAHGIGMVSHEQPEITPTSTQPLEAGMVLSIETEFIHPEVGHVKIEDAVAVTDTGCEGLGDLGRAWQVVVG